MSVVFSSLTGNIQKLNPELERYLEQQLIFRQGFVVATLKQAGKPILSIAPNAQNLAEIQTFVQRLNPKMERYLEQQLQGRKGVFFAIPKQEGKTIRLAVSRHLEQETVVNVIITYKNNMPILKGKVFTR